jgi:hypothetical protein
MVSRQTGQTPRHSRVIFTCADGRPWFVQERREEAAGSAHRRMKEPMKESGSPDLKAQRNAHMAPTTGHPMSPGGSRARLPAPREASLAHPWALRTTASMATTNTAATAANKPGPAMPSPTPPQRSILE